MERLWRLLFPPKCVLCRRILEKDETDLCRHCRLAEPDHADKSRRLRFLDGWTAVWYYEGAPRKSLLRYKFSGAKSYAPSYGRLLAMKLTREYPEGFDLLTWVPVAPLRRLRRGYDQAQLLAEAVGAELDMEPKQLLKKIRNNPPQSSIKGQAERRANVLGVYQVISAQAVEGKRILLLDDVITTGATAGEAARMLLTAGARQVYCGAVAAVRHGEKRSR